jgi:hypothetical protein
MIKACSIPHEYYLGDFPGTLQYKKEQQEIIDCQLAENDNDCGFRLCEHSLENLRRITPLSQRDVEWKIILMMRTERGEEIWLKAALLNKTTGKIALLTATNDKKNIESRGSRAVKTVDGTWFVGHYRMSAPVVFWRELKNRLLY